VECRPARRDATEMCRDMSASTGPAAVAGRRAAGCDGHSFAPLPEPGDCIDLRTDRDDAVRQHDLDRVHLLRHMRRSALLPAGCNVSPGAGG